MSARNWRSLEQQPKAGPGVRRQPAGRSHLAMIVVLGLASLIVARVAMVASHRSEDKKPERAATRQQNIQRWMEQTLANPEARVVSYGDIQRDYLKNQPWLEAMISEMDKPMEHRYSIYRFTFGPSGEVVDARPRPVP